MHDIIAGTLIVRRTFTPEAIKTAGPAPRVSALVTTFAVIGILLFGSFGIGVLAAIAIPAYQDYAVRAQIADGLNSAAQYKAAVTEAVAQGNDVHNLTNEVLRLPESGTSRYVSTMKIYGGVIEISYSALANAQITGKTVLLIPATSDSGQALVWTCWHMAFPSAVTPVTPKDLSQYTTVPDKYLPTGCRAPR